LLDPVKVFASHISFVLFWPWAIVVIWGECLNNLSELFFLFLVICGTFGCARAGFEGYLVYQLNKICHLSLT
jgi:hypothetical protein